MSIYIAYKGCLDSLSQQKVLIEELIDISRSMNWEWHAITQSTVAASQGVQVLVHPRCRPLVFQFDKDGCLFDDEQDEIRIDTQASTPDTHTTLIKLLDYFGRKYFRDFVLYDDTGYAESGDTAQIEVFFAHRQYNLVQIRKLLAHRANKILHQQSDYLATNKIENMLQKRLQNVLLHRITIKSGLS